MNYRKALWSIILILFGLLMLADNFNLFEVRWLQLFSLWPILFILWGISFIPTKDYIKFISSVVVIATAAVIFIFTDNRPSIFIGNNGNWRYSVYESDDDDDDDSQYSSENQNKGQNYIDDMNFCQDYEGEKEIILDMSLVVGTYNFHAADDYTNNTNSFCLKKSDDQFNYSLVSKNIDSYTKEIDFALAEGQYDTISSTATFDYYLNSDIVWDINIEGGASKMKIDGTELKIKEIDISQGAASSHFIIGKNYPKVDVNIDSGVSKITIDIPKDAYCVVHKVSALSGFTLNGFNKKDDNKYVYNEKLDSPSCRIDIELDTALSRLEINRY